MPFLIGALTGSPGPPYSKVFSVVLLAKGAAMWETFTIKRRRWPQRCGRWKREMMAFGSWETGWRWSLLPMATTLDRAVNCQVSQRPHVAMGNKFFFLPIPTVSIPDLFMRPAPDTQGVVQVPTGWRLQPKEGLRTIQTGKWWLSEVIGLCPGL